MNPDTGEIRFFEQEDSIPEDWIGLDMLKPGETLTVAGIEMHIVEAAITPGTPGEIKLLLRGITEEEKIQEAHGALQSALGDTPATRAYEERMKKSTKLNYFRDVMLAHKQNSGTKEWE